MIFYNLPHCIFTLACIIGLQFALNKYMNLTMNHLSILFYLINQYHIPYSYVSSSIISPNEKYISPRP